MTLPALNAEIRTARRRIQRDLAQFFLDVDNADAARSLLSLLLRFEYHWKQRLKLARRTKQKRAA